MKKIAPVIACLVCCLVLLSSGVIVGKYGSSLDFTFDDQGQYTGFDSLPPRYTLELKSN